MSNEQDFFNKLAGAKEPETVVKTVEEIITPDAVVVDAVKTEPIIEDNKPIDYNQRVSELFGYSSIDDLLNSDAPTKLKQHNEAIENLNKYRLENDELISEFGTISNPFANTKMAQLNQMQLTHPELSFEVASTLLSKPVSEMSKLEQIILAEKVKNPELSDAHIKRYLESQLKVDDFSDLEDTDDKNVKLDIDIMSVRAAKELSKYSVVDVSKDDKYIPAKVQERINERIEKQKVNLEDVERVWTPAVQHLEANFKEIDIPIPNNDNKHEAYTKFVLTEQQRKESADLAMLIAKTNGFKEINENNLKIINEAVYLNFVGKNLPNIIKIVVDKATNDEFQRYKRERDGIIDVKKDVSDKGITGSTDIMEIIGRQVKQKSFRDLNK